MADETKPEIDMKEEQAKTKKIVETREEVPIKSQEIKPDKPIEKKPEDKPLEKVSKVEEEPVEEKKEEKPETKPEDKKPILKKAEKPKVKKTEAVVRSFDLPISTKQSSAICKFIKGKLISQAIRELEEVTKLKMAVPVKGEHPHRKGKIMSGKYPQKATKNFIVLLKSLAANATDINEPVIVEAIANIGSRPYGRFGTIRRKRTHVFIKVKEKSPSKLGRPKEKKLKKTNKNGRKKSS
jgi:ribosomal protein L22